MKNISKALIATVLVCCLSFFQKKDNDEIVWSATYKLKWTDFKGKPDYNDTYKAYTSYSLKCKSTFSKFNDSISFNVYSKFWKLNSWSIDTNSLKLLAHEQLHFNIAELSARKFRRRLNENKMYRYVVHLQFDSIYNGMSKADALLQTQYDLETNHSLNEAKQKEWELRIAKELKELEAYSNTEVKVKLYKKGRD